jgi:hypothetical protein
LQERFDQFNEPYFDGELPDYEVRVVNDPNFSGNKPRGEPTSGLVEFDARVIFIGLMRDRFMSEALLHHMAHVATET